MEPMVKLRRNILRARQSERSGLKKELLATFNYLYGNVLVGRGRQPLQRTSKGMILLEKMQASVRASYDTPRSNLLAPNHSSKRKMNRKSPNGNHSEIKQKSMKLLELISSNPVKEHKKSTDEFDEIEQLLRHPDFEDRLLYVRPPRFRVKLVVLRNCLLYTSPSPRDS